MNEFFVGLIKSIRSAATDLGARFIVLVFQERPDILYRVEMKFGFRGRIPTLIVIALEGITEKSVFICPVIADRQVHVIRIFTDKSKCSNPFVNLHIFSLQPLCRLQYFESF